VIIQDNGGRLEAVAGDSDDLVRRWGWGGSWAGRGSGATVVWKSERIFYLYLDDGFCLGSKSNQKGPFVS
jgi:hypothetical protein